MSTISKVALDAAAAEFALSWPTDERMLQPPWPLDYQNEGLRRFVGGIITQALRYDSARALLREADLQLAYLDSRFPTGTTPTIRSRIAAELGDKP